MRCPACLEDYTECGCVKWCEACDCYTNHTGAQHRAAQEE